MKTRDVKEGRWVAIGPEPLLIGVVRSVACDDKGEMVECVVHGLNGDMWVVTRAETARNFHLMTTPNALLVLKEALR